MLKTIKINYELIEIMQYFWESVASKQKVTDAFIIEIGENPEMTPLYDEDFSQESFREVLSAINNSELVNHPTKKESRFWNLNMWMMEDLEFTNAMLQPVKLLNLDLLYDEYKDNSNYEELVVNIVPGHVDEYYIDGNILTFNFFKISLDIMDLTQAKVGDKEFKEYILDRAREVLG